MSQDFDSYWGGLWQALRQQSTPGEDNLPRTIVGEQFQVKLDQLIFARLPADPAEGQINWSQFLLQREWQQWQGRAKAFFHAELQAIYQSGYEKLEILRLTSKPQFDPILETRPLPEPPIVTRQVYLHPRPTVEAPADAEDGVASAC
jgi:hypothetical protein